MKRQTTEHPPDNRRASRLPSKQPAGKQSTDYRTRKKNLGSGFWVLGSKNGFTMVELMIAITITVLAMAGVYTSFIVQQRSFVVQDQVSETQMSSKIAFNLIANDIRNAGFGYPFDESPPINTFTGNITVDDNSGPDGADAITLVGGFRQVATLAVPAVVGETSISISYVGATSFNLSNKSNISIEGIDFATIDPTNNGGCTLSGLADCLDSSPIFLDRGISKPFPAGRPVYLVEDITYGIDLQGNGTDDLERQGQIGMPTPTVTVANNIDDFQIVEIDEDGDGITDRVRVSVLARTAHEDQALNPATKPYFSTGIVLENNTTTVDDRFRRRIWSMEIALRNPE